MRLVEIEVERLLLHIAPVDGDEPSRFGLPRRVHKVPRRQPEPAGRRHLARAPATPALMTTAGSADRSALSGPAAPREDAPDDSSRESLRLLDERL